MRIDYQQGDHLRVGRLLIARARQSEDGPVLDGGGSGLVRMNEDTATAALRRAQSLVELLDSDTIDPDEVHHEMLLVRQILRDHELATEVEQFGALVFHRPGSARAIAVGWLNARAPHPNRWRPRFLLAQARWVLAGRPANVYIADSGELRGKTHGGGEGRAVEFIERTTLKGDGSFAGHPGAPFGDNPVELWPNEGTTK